MPKTDQSPTLLKIQFTVWLIDCQSPLLFKLAHPSHVTFTSLVFMFATQYRLFIFERMVWHRSCSGISDRAATKSPKGSEILKIGGCGAPLYGTR
jgi:hypothetical protein